MTDTFEVSVTEVVADQGTIVIFAGDDGGGGDVLFGVDHRLAQALVTALDGDEAPIALVEPWQVLYRREETS